MARTTNLLKAKEVMSLPSGRHGDGNGLYLDVKPPSKRGGAPARSWSVVFSFKNHRKEAGIGTPDNLTLSEARERRDAIKKMARLGINPIEEQHAARMTRDLKPVVQAEPAAKTFGQFADERFKQLEKRWESPRTRQSWVNTLENWCAPLRSVPLAEIRQKHVLMVVQERWETTSDMAAQVQERLKALFKTAIALGEHPGPNPAEWEEKLSEVLAPKKKLARGKHPALDFEEARTSTAT